MKRQLSKLLLLCMSVAVISTTIISCKSKPKDADIKASVETLLKANPDLQGIAADVKEGVVTLSGEVKSEAAKTAAETAIAAVAGLKSVANNITIAAPPPPPAVVVPSADDALATGLKDVLKDFGGVTSSVKDGIVTLTGEITKAKWVVLKQAIDKLTPKGYELKGLKIK